VVLDVNYSSDARLIATGHTDNLIRLWDPRSEGNRGKREKLKELEL
jgi:ribosome biogenesis protein YTM1